jgi:hypothetical protein
MKIRLTTILTNGMTTRTRHIDTILKSATGSTTSLTGPIDVNRTTFGIGVTRIPTLTGAEKRATRASFPNPNHDHQVHVALGFFIEDSPQGTHKCLQRMDQSEKAIPGTQNIGRPVTFDVSDLRLMPGGV